MRLAAHDSQCDDADKDDVAGDRSTGERLTFKTVAIVPQLPGSSPLITATVIAVSASHSAVEKAL
jgi:hypothetical protein